MGLIKSLRKGNTGIGYTFETLVGKKEDQEITPDFKDVEIKCKLGYSKTDINLFTSTPKLNNKLENILVDKYIFEKYSYHSNNDYNAYRIFCRKFYTKSNYELYNISFNLRVDYLEKKILIKSFKNGIFLENVCYWDFDELYKRLTTKLTKLALITGYPFYKDGITYYKYYTIKFYYLKNFETFLKLIENNKIYVSVYLREDVNKLGDYKIKNSGFTFRISKNDIEKLFNRVFIK